VEEALMRGLAAAGRGALLVGLVAVAAGCPAEPSTGPERAVHQPSLRGAGTPSPRPSTGTSPTPKQAFDGKSPVPFDPNDVNALPSPESSEAGSSKKSPEPGDAIPRSLTLGPLARSASKPARDPDYSFQQSNLFAGPFPMNPRGVLVHVRHTPLEAPGRLTLHLDSEDQKEKNLVLEATGKLDTTFSFPGRAGNYAFYLQLDPVQSWQIDVYEVPPSPSPSTSPSASSSPGKSPSPGASKSPSPSPSPSASP
jgi:hypothetical protein